MSNSLYKSLGGGQSPKNPVNALMQQMNQLRENPMQFLMQRKLNIPAELNGNPQGIVQHLLNSGQMSQEQFTKLQSIINSMSSN